MAVALKRSDHESRITRSECEYGCCSDLYGKNVKHNRRRARRQSERAWRKDLKNEIRA